MRRRFRLVPKLSTLNYLNGRYALHYTKYAFFFGAHHKNANEGRPTLSATKIYYHIRWNTWKIIAPLISLRSSLSADSNIMSLLQREHNEILAGIRVGYGKSCSRRTNYCVISSANLYKLHRYLQRHRPVFLRQHGFLVTFVSITLL